MAGPDLKVTVSGDTNPVNRAMDRAVSATRKYQDSLLSLEIELRKVEHQLEKDSADALAKQTKAMEEQRDAAARMGKGMMTAGIAIGAGLALAVNEAVKWESAWAGVNKVVNGSPEQMAQLEGELRNLARTLPTTHEEIASVAEAAGQLGVKRQDIAKFTKVMVEMGVSTNLTADEAATSMARFSNIMGIPIKDVDRLGSAIVALGNDGASTEQDIVNMALRIAGAGRVAGLTAPQVLAVANALSSVGIEAEAGGSAISTVFIKMSQAVADNGDDLEAWAQVAGVSAKRFADQWRKDPAAALLMFEDGLKRVQDSGGNTFQVLENLGLTEIRQRDAVLRLSGAHDILAGSLKTGADAWKENNALQNEANRRFETTESRAKIARNQLVDLGISIGDVLLPALGQVASAATGMLQFFNGLPGPVKTAIAILGTAAAIILTVGGAALVAVPRIAAMRATLATLGGVGGAAATGLRGVSSVMLGPWGLAITAGVAALGYFAAKSHDSAEATRALKDTLDESTGALTDNTRAAAAKMLSDAGVLKAADSLGLSLKGVTDAALGNTEAFKSVNAQLDAAIDKGTSWVTTGEGTQMVMDENARAAKRVKDAIGDQNSALAESIATKRREIQATGDDTKAKGDNATATDGAKTATQGFTTASDDAAMSASDLKRAIDDIKESMRLYSDEAMSSEEANIAFRDQIRAMSKDVKENGTAFTENTKKGDANRKMLLDGIDAAGRAAKAAFDKAEAEKGHSAAVREANGVMAKNIGTLIKEADHLGLNRQQTRQYIATILGVPVKSVTNYTAPGLADALGKAHNLEDTANRTNGKHVKVTTTTPGLVDANARASKQERLANALDGRVVDVKYSTTYVTTRIDYHRSVEGGTQGSPGHPNYHRAAGGPVWPGPSFLVGENGPELVKFPSQGTVIPADTTRSLMTGPAPSAKNGGRVMPALTAGAGGAGSAGIVVERLIVNRAPDEPTTHSVDAALQRTAFMIGV